MACGRRQFSHADNFRTADSRTYAEPVLLLWRRVSDSAYHDKLSKNAEIASNARVWIEAETNWTRRQNPSIPPPEIRDEYVGTFDWICEHMGEDPDRIRPKGLTRTFYVGSSQGAETWGKNKP